MARLSIATLAILASTCLAAAMPSLPRSDDPNAPFSFENWVNDIIANPEGHLSPEEAVQAYYSSGGEASGSLNKRVTCRDDRDSIKSAFVPDAVACINYLASLGDQPCNVKGATTLCSIGGARITGVAGGGGVFETSDTCQSVARSAGKIMDKCTRSDNTVNGSELSWNQQHMMVHISGP